MSSAAVGISFGSESVVVAVTNTSGNPQVYANADGDRVTPAYTAFIDGEVIHGNAARNAFVRQPVQTVPYLLPLLSPDVVNAGSLAPKCDVEVVTDAATGEDRVVIPNVDTDGVLPTVLPRPADADADDKTNPHLTSELIASFLGNVKAKGIDGPVNGRPVTCLCVSVPRYMDQSLVRRAVEGANLTKEVRVIYDDVAAVLASQIGNVGGAALGPKATMLTERTDILVIDWGANVLAASLLRLEGGSFRVLGHTHRFGAGGAVIDKHLAKNCCDGFYKKYKIDATENGRAMRKLLLALEGVRKTLSMSPMCPVDVEAFCDGIDLKDNLSRVKLDMAIRDCGLLDKLNDTLKTVLDMVDPCESVNVQHVVLSGGLCRTPYLQTSIRVAVQNIIPGGESAKTYEDIATDEVAAVGACTEAMLSTASYASLTQPAAEVPAAIKYRPVVAAIKDVDMVDMDALDAGIALYVGSAPFATTAVPVDAAKVQIVLAEQLGVRVASPTGVSQQDFTKAAAEKGAYEVPTSSLFSIAARGAAMPVSSPLIEAAVGSAVLPVAVVAASETHSYVLPLLKKPHKLATPNFKILVAPEQNGGVTAVSVLEAAADGSMKVVEHLQW